MAMRKKLAPRGEEEGGRGNERVINIFSMASLTGGDKIYSQLNGRMAPGSRLMAKSYGRRCGSERAWSTRSWYSGENAWRSGGLRAGEAVVAAKGSISGIRTGSLSVDCVSLIISCPTSAWEGHEIELNFFVVVSQEIQGHQGSAMGDPGQESLII